MGSGRGPAAAAEERRGGTALTFCFLAPTLAVAVAVAMAVLVLPFHGSTCQAQIATPQAGRPADCSTTYDL